RARRYKRLRQEMRDLMRAVYVVDYRTTGKTLGEIETTLNEVSAREWRLSATTAEREATQDGAARAARAAEESLNETREVVSGLELDTAATRQQQAYLTEQIQSLGARSAQFVSDQAAITERGQFISQETARLREELRHIEQEINSESRTLADEENRHREQAQSDAQSERKLEEARKIVYDCVTNLERWRQLKRQFTESVDRCQDRINGLAAEFERAQTQAQAAEEQHAKLTEEADIISIRQQEFAASLSEVSDRLAEMRRTREERQAKLTGLQHEMTGAEQRLKSLVEVDERRSYFSEAVQALMRHSLQNAASSNGFSTLGTLADYVRVAPEHEAMIETTLRDELQYVVVPSFDDALRAIDYLKSEGAGRATFLVIGQLYDAPAVDPFPYLHNMEIDSSGAPDSNGGLSSVHSSGRHSQFRYQTLDSMLSIKPDLPNLADAFKLALPGLAKASVVDDAAQAIEASGSSNGSGPYVSLARTGERAIAGRLVTGGSASEKGAGVLALKREIGELREGLESLAADVRLTDAALDEIKFLIAQSEEEQKRFDGELRQIEKQSVALREQLQQCQRELERTATHIRVVEQETAQAEDELKEVEAKLGHASGQTDEAEQTHREAEASVTAAQSEMAELRRSAEARLQELSRRRADFATKTERRRGLQNDIRRLETEAADLESRLSRIRMEAVEADEQAASMRVTQAVATEQLQRLTAQKQLRAVDLERQVSALTDARARLEALDLELRSLREASTQAREQRAQKDIEKARLSSDLDHLIQSCHAELGENIAEVCERLEQNKTILEHSDDPTTSETSLPQIDREPEPQLSLSDAGNNQSNEDDEEADREIEISFWQVPDDFDLNAAKAQLEDLRKKIDALGPVNMMALEELSEVEDRFDFLVDQKMDIEKAISDTQSAIAEIKRRSREKFVEAFAAINENFKKMFIELFGGGHGEMKLIDETDVLESGIEIIAQPPGKRLQNVLLLSGGEKAMAAMSLVLAIFKYRPSPFCLLDEVDAPLDDVNIGRFADKVIEMSAETQFMIITHSKRTMEAARTLYGVTMEDPGVSKLISVKLS
ncbi:MAG TPA: hypothetical protein VKG02_22200, partial [Blastocatellia bacterium]|nr:hypothetical protein [Blastocatellia bacterium]